MVINYMRLREENIEDSKETEKSIALFNGYTGNFKNGESLFNVNYIAKSIIIEENGKMYMPSWLVSKNNLWNDVYKDDCIQKENGKKRRTHNEKLIEDIKRNFKIESNKNDLVGLNATCIIIRPMISKFERIDKRINENNIDESFIITVSLKDRKIIKYAYDKNEYDIEKINNYLEVIKIALNEY